MVRESHKEKTVLLLQSGGRDSTAAAAHLLNKGFRVVGITLASNAASKVEVPRRRALEIRNKYTNYSWGMADYTEWEKSTLQWTTDRLSAPLPKSCMLCAISRLTAVIPFCRDNSIHSISVGYTSYQAAWAEQSPIAVELQRAFLQKLGIELVLPSQIYTCKSAVKEYLIENGLTPDSLENPCCISDWGTQPVPDSLIAEVVQLTFEFLEIQTPNLSFVSTVGGLQV